MQWDSLVSSLFLPLITERAGASIGTLLLEISGSWISVSTVGPSLISCSFYRLSLRLRLLFLELPPFSLPVFSLLSAELGDPLCSAIFPDTNLSSFQRKVMAKVSVLGQRVNQIPQNNLLKARETLGETGLDFGPRLSAYLWALFPSDSPTWSAGRKTKLIPFFSYQRGSNWRAKGGSLQREQMAWDVPSLILGSVLDIFLIVVEKHLTKTNLQE